MLIFPMGLAILLLINRFKAHVSMTWKANLNDAYAAAIPTVVILAIWGGILPLPIMLLLR